MSQKQQIIFGLGMAGLIFASVFLVDYTLLRVSMWKPTAGKLSSLMASTAGQLRSAQPVKMEWKNQPDPEPISQYQ
jgi:hypothetical protein